MKSDTLLSQLFFNVFYTVICKMDCLKNRLLRMKILNLGAKSIKIV